jgi:dienelactone hydrolase
MTKQRFFRNEGFEFMTLIALGSASYRLAEVGEVLATVDAITDDDADSWFDEWMATSDRVRRIAEQAEAAGNLVSARDAFLRAANYAGTAFFYVLATKDPSRSLHTWRSHRRDFDRAMKLWPTPVEEIQIPYEGTHLHGYFWSGGPDARRTIILNNGSDGPVSDMLFMGVDDAVARGWNAITFDGPGQGYALYEQQMYFRYDWENVIAPVVDYLLTRHDVDPSQIALAGFSQGGYWVPRAAAFEKRIAAAVADPGVVRVDTSWRSHLPQVMLDLLDAGQDEEFDGYFAEAMKQEPDVRRTLPKRMEPYGTTSMAALLHELEKWDLSDVAGQIQCPILITNPEDEQFWPGQSQQLFDQVSSEVKELMPFTAAEGGNWHCEPMAPQLRAQRVFDWLEQVVKD